MSEEQPRTPQKRLLDIWLAARQLSEEAVIAYHTESEHHRGQVEKYVRGLLRSVRTIEQ